MVPGTIWRRKAAGEPVRETRKALKKEVKERQIRKKKQEIRALGQRWQEKEAAKEPIEMRLANREGEQLCVRRERQLLTPAEFTDVLRYEQPVLWRVFAGTDVE